MKLIINLIMGLVSTTAMAAANQITPSTTSTQVTASATNQTSATQTELKVTPKKWQLRYYNYWALDATKAHTGAFNELNMNLGYSAYIGGFYQVSDVAKVGVRQWFHTESIDKRLNFAQDDISLEYSRSKVFSFLGKDVSFSFRQYLPTSNVSQENDVYQTRIYLTSSANLGGKWSASYAVNPRLYSMKDDRGQVMAKLLIGGGISHETAKWVSFGSEFYLYPYWSNPGKNSEGKDVDTNTGYFIHNINASFTITPNISLITYLEQGRKLKATTAYIPLNEDESYYALELLATL